MEIAPALMTLCRQLDANGKMEESIRQLTIAISASEIPSLFYERGWRFEELGQYDLAKEDYSQAIRMDPASRYLVARGLLRSTRLSDFEGSQEDLYRALALDDRNAEVLVLIALNYLESGRLSEAITNAGLAVELAPADAVTHDCLGQCQLAGKNFPDAVQSFLTSTRLNPRSSNSWRLLSIALQNTGDVAAARSSIEKAIAIEKTPSFLISYASLSIEMRDHQSALKALNEARSMSLSESQKCLVDGYWDVASRMITA